MTDFGSRFWNIPISVLEELFLSKDKDGNGVIDSKELGNCLKSVGLSISKVRGKAFFWDLGFSENYIRFSDL